MTNVCLEYALPFGGVGNSGLGNYHGPRSFRTFTHERSVMGKKLNMESLMAVRYPPYTSNRMGMLRMLMITSPTSLKLKAWKGPLKKLVIFIFLLFLYFKKARV